MLKMTFWTLNTMCLIVLNSLQGTKSSGISNGIGFKASLTRCTMWCNEMYAIQDEKNTNHTKTPLGAM